MGIIFHPYEPVCQRLGNELCPGRALQAMRRKQLKLGVICGMKAAMGNQENLVTPRRVGELANIGQEFLSSRHVQLTAGQHEIGLHVHFPENVIARSHSVLSMLVTYSLSCWQSC